MRPGLGCPVNALVRPQRLADGFESVDWVRVLGRYAHATDVGVNKLGPCLEGVVGRTSGTVPGFEYSPALAERISG
jgi:hypothetical protein